MRLICSLNLNNLYFMLGKTNICIGVGYMLYGLCLHLSKIWTQPESDYLQMWSGRWSRSNHNAFTPCVNMHFPYNMYGYSLEAMLAALRVGWQHAYNCMLLWKVIILWLLYAVCHFKLSMLTKRLCIRHCFCNCQRFSVLVLQMQPPRMSGPW